jgi:hypothetical protein
MKAKVLRLVQIMMISRKDVTDVLHATDLCKMTKPAGGLQGSQPMLAVKGRAKHNPLLLGVVTGESARCRGNAGSATTGPIVSRLKTRDGVSHDIVGSSIYRRQSHASVGTFVLHKGTDGRAGAVRAEHFGCFRICRYNLGELPSQVFGRGKLDFTLGLTSLPVLFSTRIVTVLGTGRRWVSDSACGGKCGSSYSQECVSAAARGFRIQCR